MKKITYHKLVRDKIPDIIKQAGKNCTFTILSDEDYLKFLDKKLNEELAEYQESKSMEELTDLQEVIQAVAIARGSSPEEIESIRKAKVQNRGGFEKKILLEEVSEP